MLSFFKKTTLAFLAVLVLVTGLASPAFANTGGGTGGNGSGGSASGGGTWRGLFDSKPGPVWNAFLQSGPWSTAGAVADAGGQELVALCQQSQAIWWFAQGSSNNFYDGFGGSRTLDDNANQLRNIPYVPTAWNNRAADWTDPNIRQRTERPYIIICSAAIGLQDHPDRVRTETTYRSEYGNDATVFTHPYAYTTAVSRQITEGGIDPIGVDNLEDQPAKTVKTEYGKLYDSFQAGGSTGITPAQLNAQVSAALEKDKGLEKGSVDLSDNNKAGLAEGGVLNVDLRVTNATIDISTSTRNVFRTVCTFTSKWDLQNQNWGSEVKTCAGEVPHDSHKTYSSNKSQGTPQAIGFWQILSVHCNADEFNELVNASGATVQNTGDPTKNLSAVAYSQKYDTRPSRLDFGDKSNPNPALARSGELGFYDKECGFLCTSDPNGSGASNENGAKENVNSAGSKTANGRAGAVVETVNSNTFEMFRDNEAKTVKLDVRYPVNNGVVNYDGRAPQSTTVVRWAEGTPTSASDSGGKFTLTAKTPGGKETELFTGGQSPSTQKNWSKDHFSGANATQLDGFYRLFDAKATWASDDGKPQVINVKWEYAPEVDTTFSSTVGFSSSGGIKRAGDVVVATPIEGKCYTEYGPAQSQIDTVNLFKDNTGTGSTNNLDGNLVDSTGTLPGESPKLVDPVANLVIKFVRSVTE